MNILQAAVLGLVQGLAEFLPISSSGHLILARAVMGISDAQAATGPYMMLDVLLHAGTLLAVLVVFWKDWWAILKNPFRSRTLLLLIIASLPALAVVVLLVRNEWIGHADKNENVRVEKVYQQYTKADLCYFDDNGRKIMNTVWLDIPGIRDGDYVECYTGAGNDRLFLNYKAVTLTAAILVMAVFILLLILTGLELRRMKKEDTLQIILEDVGGNTADEEV